LILVADPLTHLVKDPLRLEFVQTDLAVTSSQIMRCQVLQVQSSSKHFEFFIDFRS